MKHEITKTEFDLLKTNAKKEEERVSSKKRLQLFKIHFQNFKAYLFEKLSNNSILFSYNKKIYTNLSIFFFVFLWMRRHGNNPKEVV